MGRLYILTKTNDPTLRNWLRKYITDYMITKYQTYAYHCPENIATTKTLNAAFSINFGRK